MCGRFSQEAELSEIKLELKVEQLELFREFCPRYNIAPSSGPGAEQAFVLRDRAGQRALRLGRWWMIPHFWSQPLKALPAAFNARAEDLERKPFWRKAFNEYRCLVPATGWREFKAVGQRKQPYQFRLSHQPFAFAGLWSSWTSPDGELVDSFAVVTTAPNAQAVEYHSRMPLVAPPDLYDAWLDPKAEPRELLAELCARSAAMPLEVYPSDPRGNNVRFEGPEVVARFDPASSPDVGNRKKPRKAAASQQDLFAAKPRKRER